VQASAASSRLSPSYLEYDDGAAGVNLKPLAHSSSHNLHTQALQHPGGLPKPHNTDITTPVSTNSRSRRGWSSFANKQCWPQPHQSSGIDPKPLPRPSQYHKGAYISMQQTHRAVSCVPQAQVTRALHKNCQEAACCCRGCLHTRTPLLPHLLSWQPDVGDIVHSLRELSTCTGNNKHPATRRDRSTEWPQDGVQ